MYSTRIITLLNEGIPESSKIQANVVTQTLGYSGLASVFCFILVPKFKRKTILVTGFILLAICLGLISYFMFEKQSLFCVITMNVFMVVNQLSAIGLVWIYIPEVTNDEQTGFASTVFYLNGVELSLVTEYMLESWRPQGMFLFYSVITFTGVFFIILGIKETSGLTDKQKKNLFIPQLF